MGGMVLEKIKISLFFTPVTLYFSFFYPSSTLSQDSFHKKIILRGAKAGL